MKIYKLAQFLGLREVNWLKTIKYTFASSEKYKREYSIFQALDSKQAVKTALVVKIVQFFGVLTLTHIILSKSYNLGFGFGHQTLIS